MKKTPQGIKVVSLFDGISCARVALKKARIPVTVYYASEIDRYAMQVSNKNFPDIVQIGDITTLDERFDINESFAGGGTDLLIGGSPCQDLSIAKKNRQGLEGKRSGLFWEYVKVLKKLKPKYFVLENVASMPKEAKELITKTLGVEPIMINASLVSAQNRKRLFWTNIPRVKLPKDKEIYLKDILQPESEVDEKYYIKDSTLKTILEKMIAGKPIAQAFRIRSVNGKSVALSALGGGSGAKTGLYHIEPVALRNRGNGKMPEFNGTGKANSLTTVQTDSMVYVVPEATKKGYALAKEGDYIDLSFPTSKTRRGRVGKKAGNLMSSNLNVYTFKKGRVRKLTPLECCRLQGLPDGYTKSESDSQQYKMLGNAFNVDVVAHILSFIKKLK